MRAPEWLNRHQPLGHSLRLIMVLCMLIVFTHVDPCTRISEGDGPRGPRVSSKSNHHGGGQHGAVVQLRRPAAPEDRRREESQGRIEAVSVGAEQLEICLGVLNIGGRLSRGPFPLRFLRGIHTRGSSVSCEACLQSPSELAFFMSTLARRLASILWLTWSTSFLFSV